MYKKEHINSLLRKFYDAALTEEEELELFELLRVDGGKDFADDADLLGAIEEAKVKAAYPECLDACLDSLIDRLERKGRHGIGLWRKIIIMTGSAAALLALAFGILRLSGSAATGPRSSNIYVVTDPHEAKKLMETVNDSYELFAAYCRSKVVKSDTVRMEEFREAVDELGDYDFER